MNIRQKIGKPAQVKLLAQEIAYLESCQGLMCLLARTLDGDRLGEAAMHAEENIRTVLELVQATVPPKLEPKEEKKTEKKGE